MTVVTTMVLGAIFYSSSAVLSSVMLSLAVCGTYIIVSIIGTFFVKIGAN